LKNISAKSSINEVVEVMKLPLLNKSVVIARFTWLSVSKAFVSKIFSGIEKSLNLVNPPECAQTIEGKSSKEGSLPRSQCFALPRAS
jgi:hypothetical protein